MSDVKWRGGGSGGGGGGGGGGGDEEQNKGAKRHTEDRRRAEPRNPGGGPGWSVGMNSRAGGRSGSAGWV
ncbi:unnamed protein product [Merluccius merluccius]